MLDSLEKHESSAAAESEKLLSPQNKYLDFSFSDWPKHDNSEGDKKAQGSSLQNLIENIPMKNN